MGKVFYITGASDGLGLATAKRLLDRGEKVIGLSRSKPDDARIGHIELNLMDENSIVAAAQQIAKTDGQIALVNCAGVMAVEDKSTMDEIERVFRTNTTGPILLESLLFDNIRVGGGVILNVISTSAIRGDVAQPFYSSSKWGLLGFTKSLTARLKDSPARAIAFIPGGFQSSMPEKAGRPAIPDPENWMPVGDVADVLVSVLVAPPTMEISEIVINRKKKP